MKVLTTATFLRRLRELLKTYPHVISDIEPLIKLLKQGETPGDRVQRAGGRAIFKVRAPNQDAQSGKRGILWNYVRFPVYVADRIVLRKVGGGYIFIHRMLMECFSSGVTLSEAKGLYDNG